MLRTAGVVCFVSLVTFLAACGPGEPRHRGRTATSWIQELGRSHVPNEILGRSSGKAAQEALRAIGPAAVPAGVRALAHRKWHVRVGAAHALGLYGPDAAPAIPALIEAVKDPYGAVSSMAGSALGEVGDAALPQLAELLAHPDAGVRITAARSILHIDPRSPDAFRVLIEGLRYLDPIYRDAVGGWGADQEKWDGFIHVERDGKRIYNREHDVRAQAARALGSLGPDAERAVPDLIAVLRDRRYEDPGRSAALALGAIGPPASPAVPALLETLASAGAHIRERPAGEYLVEASSHALGRIGFGPAALPELFRMLRSPQPRWYDSLPSAFRGAPDEAVAGLGALLSSVDPHAAGRAAYALGEMGPRAAPALPALLEALRGEPCKVRSAAAFALAQIGVRDEAALRGLEKLLEDPDETCRAAARGALVKLAPS